MGSGREAFPPFPCRKLFKTVGFEGAWRRLTGANDSLRHCGGGWGREGRRFRPSRVGNYSKPWVLKEPGDASLEQTIVCDIVVGDGVGKGGVSALPV